MRVCVIGGAGYVGQVLCQSLIKHGYDVSVVDLLLYGVRPTGPFMVADAREATPLWFVGTDAIINLAGFSNDPMADFRPDLNWSFNVQTAAKISWAAAEAGVGRLIFASSCSIYHGSSFAVDGDVGESCQVAPKAHYALSKYAGEMASLSFDGRGDRKMAVTCLRKGTISGPSRRMRYDLLLNTMFKDAVKDSKVVVHGGGWAYRPLLSIDDAAAAYVAVLSAPAGLVGGQIFNVVSENDTVRSYARRLTTRLAEKLGKTLTVEHTKQTGPTRSYRVSWRKLTETVGWVPKFTCEDVLDQLYLAHMGGGLPSWDDYQAYNIETAKRIF